MPFCKGVEVSKLAKHTPLLSLRVCSVLLFRANQLLDRANERDGGFLSGRATCGFLRETNLRRNGSAARIARCRDVRKLARTNSRLAVHAGVGSSVLLFVFCIST